MTVITCILIIHATVCNVEALDEFQIRSLNNDINELIKQKKAWDFRVRQLGGFKTRLNERFEDIGTEGPLGDGYYYFGRAKELPEFRAKQAEEEARRRGDVVETIGDRDRKENVRLRESLLARVDAEYYGYGVDEEELVEAEQQAELDPPLHDWLRTDRPTVFPTPAKLRSFLNGDSFLPVPPYAVPSQAEVEAFLVTQRKARLLALLSSK